MILAEALPLDGCCAAVRRSLVDLIWLNYDCTGAYATEYAGHGYRKGNQLEVLSYRHRVVVRIW